MPKFKSSADITDSRFAANPTYLAGPYPVVLNAELPNEDGEDLDWSKQISALDAVRIIEEARVCGQNVVSGMEVIAAGCSRHHFANADEVQSATFDAVSQLWLFKATSFGDDSLSTSARDMLWSSTTLALHLDGNGLWVLDVPGTMEIEVFDAYNPDLFEGVSRRSHLCTHCADWVYDAELVLVPRRYRLDGKLEDRCRECTIIHQHMIDDQEVTLEDITIV